MPEASAKTTQAEATTTEAPAKKAKAPKAPKEPKADATNRINFSKLYPEDSPLTLLVDKNPKKAGSKSAARFEGYTGAATVGEARAKGVTYQDIAYDVARNYIKIG